MTPDKRPYDQSGYDQPFKRFKQGTRDGHGQRHPRSGAGTAANSVPVGNRSTIPTSLPIAQVRATPTTNSIVKAPSPLPALPQIESAVLRNAPFTHSSTKSSNTDRTVVSNDTSYEQLEFLGDAYIEVFASEVIFSRFSYLPAGKMSQRREILVKNETLAVFALAYGFDTKLQETGLNKDTFKSDTNKGNKGFTKVLGDCFEAYVAAIIKSDKESGRATAEQWCLDMWEPVLEELALEDAKYVQGSANGAGRVYNPQAKDVLQKRVIGGAERTRLQYEPYKPPTELKGDRIGENRHFIAVYLTGYGHERKCLGRGEGKNKTEAGNWAAMEAMDGESKEIVEECEAKMNASKAQRAGQDAKVKTQRAQELEAKWKAALESNGVAISPSD